MTNGTNIIIYIRMSVRIYIYIYIYIYILWKFTYSKLKYVGLAQPTNIFSQIIDSHPLIGKASVAAIPCSAAHFPSCLVEAQFLGLSSICKNLIKYALKQIGTIRPYQLIFLFLIQLLSGNKCGHSQSKHTQAKKHRLISVKNDHVMPGKKAKDVHVMPNNLPAASRSCLRTCGS